MLYDRYNNIVWNLRTISSSMTPMLLKFQCLQMFMRTNSSKLVKIKPVAETLGGGNLKADHRKKAVQKHE
jgi:hypothetical protein